MLASAGDDGTIKVWDRDTGKELQSLKGHLATVRGLAFSPAGDMLASGDDVGTIRLSSVDGQTQGVSLKVPGSIRALAFHGSKLACATNEGTLRVWTAAPGNLWTLKDKEPQALANPIGALASLAFSANGVTLVAGGQNGSIALWDVASGQPRRILQGHKRAVTALAIHPLGENLVSGGSEGELLRWRGAAEEAGRIEAASGNAPAVAPPVVVRNESTEPGTERDAAPAGRRFWLVAALVGLLGAVAACLAFRRFRSNGQVGADALMVVRCSACQRQLKVKPALAGKKVRCPCGAAVPAPPSTT
jgi:hypothetical protein